MQHSSSGNDDASLSLVPTGKYMVELSKFFCKINWLLLSIYTLYYYSIQVLDKYDSGEKNKMRAAALIFTYSTTGKYRVFIKVI